VTRTQCSFTPGNAKAIFRTVSKLIVLLGMGAIIRANDCGAFSDQCAMVGMRRRESQRGQHTSGMKGQKVKIPAVGLSRGLADRVSKG
jgi:hypothetical protein